MKAPHLLPAAAAIAIAATALAWGGHYLRRFEENAVHAVAAISFGQKTQGRAMQAAAFAQPDLLPLYGGSEVITPDRLYDSVTMFRAYPEGFSVFPVGRESNECLNILQKLACVGSDLEGRRVAISVAPISFYNAEMTMPANYAGNFSAFQAEELAFNTSLSLKLRRAAALRMVDYPATLKTEPLLGFALRHLADGSTLGALCYYLALPVGKLQLVGLRLQDHVATWVELRGLGPLTAPAREPERLDWASLESDSAEAAKRNAANNPLGFGTAAWLEHQNEIMHPKRPLKEEAFLHWNAHGKQWTDLDLLLRAVQELGGRPLVISTPIMGRYLDALHVGPKAREAYYVKLGEVARLHRVELRSFREYDEAADFVYDDWGHMNCKGWVLFDRALADFYHERP
jgi:D-alanine transfer protein